MENLVYIELKRRGRDIYYHRDLYECDFLTKEKDKITGAIQVTNELNEKNSKRELNGLLEALDKHKLSNGLILTYYDEDTKFIDGKKVEILPIWKWLLI